MTKDRKLGRFGEAVQFAKSRYLEQMEEAHYYGCKDPISKTPYFLKGARDYLVGLGVGLIFDGNIGLGG